MLTDAQIQSLIDAAIEAREQAYAPYSEYKVGAAILTGSGRVVTGCNVENVSFGLSNCAERTAVFKAVSEGEREILAVAVATDNAGSPCGACRQVLVEFGGDVPVFLADTAGNMRATTLYDLLPDHFGPQNLPPTE